MKITVISLKLNATLMSEYSILSNWLERYFSCCSLFMTLCNGLKMGEYEMYWLTSLLLTKQMLTKQWAHLKASHKCTKIISKNMDVLKKYAENHHKQIITNQKYKIVSTLRSYSLQGCNKRGIRKKQHSSWFAVGSPSWDL